MSDDGDYDVDGGDFDGDDIDNDIDEAGDEAEQGENVDILPGPEQRNPKNNIGCLETGLDKLLKNCKVQ